jgi:predicted phage-related endonuclease
MTIERIPLTDDREQWLAARRNFINASEIAVVCGEAGYGSLAQLYAEKKGLRPPPPETKAMRRGKRFEATALEILRDERPEWKVERAQVHVRDRVRRLACTPDAFVLAPDHDHVGVAQVKCVSRAKFRSSWLEDPDGPIDGPAAPPAAYRMQTVFEMMLNNCKWGVIPAIINGEFGEEFEIFDIDRDPVLEDRMVYHAAKFFEDYLDPGVMPPFSPPRDEALVRALYPKDDGSEIDLRGDNRALALVEDLIETQRACKRLTQQERAIRTELCSKLGEHSFGRLADGRRLSWRRQSRRAYNVPANSFRVLRILNPKESIDE